MSEPSSGTALPRPVPGLVPVAAADAAATLRATGARGFLDLDPVTQNDDLLTRELTRRDVALHRAGETVVGSAPNRDQPRQAQVASTSADPAPVRALVEHLAVYQRCTSFVALVPDGDASLPAFTGCGFTHAGVLREHLYRSGRYHDVLVLVAGTE